MGVFMCNINDLSDLEVVARTISGEADNQTYPAKQGVGSTILKRVQLQWQHETTARGVCLHPEQYDCWLPGADYDRIMSPDIVEDPCYQDCLMIAQAVLDGTLQDNTNGADSYENTNAGAYWAKGLTPTAVIDGLSFYETRS
jgi:spore germination cell wall hydrolase CwlJ-like protein